MRIIMKFNTALSVSGIILLFITSSLGQLDVCGRARFNSRIVGGENATEGSWPWQVSIHRIGSGLRCGGTLITKDWVLSAASCVDEFSASNIVMYFGRLKQSGSNPHETSRTASRIIIHPKYNYPDHDIALIQLNSSVTFSDYIKPVCLAANGSVFDAGTESWITGWGSLKFGGQSPDTLQEVMIPIVNNSDCDKANGGIITDNMICAGLLNVGGKGVCSGDVGGPMVSKKDSLWIQSGIESFVEGCAEPEYPDVFTRVSQYQNWIKNYTDSNPPGFVEFNIQHPTSTPTSTSTSTSTSTPTSTSTSTSTPTSTPTSTSTSTSTSTPTSTPTSTSKPTPGPASNSNSRSALSLLLFSLSLTFSVIPFIFSLFLAGFED